MRVGHGPRPGSAGILALDDLRSPVEAAVQRVREAGGIASAPDRRPYGTMSDCLSPDGVAFALWEP